MAKNMQLVQRTIKFLVYVGVLCSLYQGTSAQDFRTLQNGIEYAEVRKEISGLKVNINLLRLDLTKVRLDVRHAMDAAIGTEKTSSIAKRHGAFAAINAGFFRLDSSIWAGDAAGLLVVDHRLLSENTNGRVTIAITNTSKRTEVAFGHFGNAWSRRLMIGTGQAVAVNGFNRERTVHEIVIYTPEFGASTLTTGGFEIVVRNGRVTHLSNIGSNRIPADGFVISAAERSLLAKSISAGTKVRILDPAAATAQPGGDAEDITNGVPQLIKDGKIDITWQQEKTSKAFVETRHPRTAVAKLKDGKLLMITVDGRSEASGGIGLQDLAEYLLSLGATDAMNLDGGGSTTMFVDGKIVNHPSDKEGERKVGDAILVTPRGDR